MNCSGVSATADASGECSAIAPIQANQFACERLGEKPSRPRVVTGPIKDQVDVRLLCKHSPDQINNTLALEG